MIAALLNVPADKESLMNWSFAHSDQHRKIEQAVFIKYGVALAPFILDPMPAELTSDDMTSWQQLHQGAHSGFEDILNIGGNDLSSVDFSKQDQVAAWIRLHFESHRQAQQALGFSD